MCFSLLPFVHFNFTKKMKVTIWLAMLCLKLATASQCKNFRRSMLIDNDEDIENECRNEDFSLTLEKVLDNEMSLASGCNALKEIYEMRLSSKEFSVESINGETLVKEISVRLENLFREREAAIQSLVEAAEASAEKFNWSAKPKEIYINAQYLGTTGPEDDEYSSLRHNITMIYSSHFQRDVNFSTSIVQVPFDIYCKKINLLRAIEWSKTIDETFKQNHEKFPQISFQYFGSVLGFIRVYPAYPWKVKLDDDQPNVYDCRTTKWYVQAANPPKNMVVLLDSSGSMMGLRIASAKLAVRALLSMLGDEDFFTVMAFNDTTTALHPCFNDTLLSANYVNKQIILERLDTVKPGGVTDFQLALNKTFYLLLQFIANNSQPCDSVIMLIADGAPENLQEVFSSFNSTMQIRVFSYLIGQDKTYMNSLKQIACKYNGLFAHVEGSSNVIEQILPHVEIINRPMAASNIHNIVWTKPFFDDTTRKKSSIEDRVCSVASPVYLNSNNSVSTLLGVVGTDVSIKSMLKKTSSMKMGVNTRLFMVDNRGYVVFHPSLKAKVSEKVVEEQIFSRYSSIDFEFLERTSSPQKLRSLLVQQKKGIVPSVTTFVPNKNWEWLVILNTSYYVNPIKGTPFSIALSLPSEYGHTYVRYSDSLKAPRYIPDLNEEHCNRIQMQARNANIIFSRVGAICSFNFSDITLPDQWSYCWSQENQNGESNKTQVDLIKLFLTKTDLVNCNEELIDSLLFDAYATAPLVTFWSDLKRYKNHSSFEINMSFVITKSGMTRAYWHLSFSEEQQKQKTSFLQFQEKLFPDFYQRAASLKENQWLYMIVSKEDRSILAAKAIRIKGTIMGVIGLTLSYRGFLKVIAKASDFSKRSLCDWNNKIDRSTNCYVMDENGIIVVAEDERLVGSYFGTASTHPYILSKLIEAGVMNQIQLIDHFAFCNSRTVAASSSSWRVTPMYSLLMKGSLWIKEIVRFLIRILFIFCHNFSQVSSVTVQNTTVNRFCQRQHRFVIANTSKLPFYHKIKCGQTQCGKDISVFAINKSNLFLIIVPNPISDIESIPGCSCITDFKLNQSKKEETIENNSCDKIRDSKERRRLGNCISWKKELSPKDSSCRATSSALSFSFLFLHFLPMINFALFSFLWIT